MTDIIALLVAERDRLNAAIAALEGPKRRGRPPGPAKPESKWTAARRKLQAERMREAWRRRKTVQIRKAS